MLSSGLDCSSEGTSISSLLVDDIGCCFECDTCSVCRLVSFFDCDLDRFGNGADDDDDDDDDLDADADGIFDGRDDFGREDVGNFGKEDS